MVAINIDQVTEELRLLKGIPKADQEQDDLLALIVRDSFERMIAYVNQFSETDEHKAVLQGLAIKHRARGIARFI